MWSALEGRPVSRGAQSVPSHLFHTHVNPHWCSLVIFIMLLHIWCSIWKIPWPTLVWNKIPTPPPPWVFSLSVGLFHSSLLIWCRLAFQVSWAEQVLLELLNLQIQLLHFSGFPGYRGRDTDAPNVFRVPGFTGKPLRPCKSLLFIGQLPLHHLGAC